eukprot:3063276-Alexandrium_andersonii.AAC.1
MAFGPGGVAVLQAASHGVYAQRPAPHAGQRPGGHESARRPTHRGAGPPPQPQVRVGTGRRVGGPGGGALRA